MEGIKKFFKIPVGFYPIAIISYFGFAGYVATLAGEASFILRSENIEKYRGIFFFEFTILIVGFIHFLSSLGLIFRNVLLKKVFIASTGILLLYEIGIFVTFNFHILLLERVETEKVIYKTSLYGLFYILCLNYIFLPSIEVAFPKNHTPSHSS